MRATFAALAMTFLLGACGSSSSTQPAPNDGRATSTGASSDTRGPAAGTEPNTTNGNQPSSTPEPQK